MQKKIKIVVLVYTCFGLSIMCMGKAKSESIIDRISKDVLEQVSVKITSVHSESIKSVFSPDFYRVKLCINSPGSPYLELNYAFVYELKNKLNYLQMPTGDQTIPQCLKIINKKFRLTENSNSALVLEKALNIIEPVSTKGNKMKKIKCEDNKWTFIRSKFFNNYSGYVFYTDDEGKVTKVEYSTNL